MPYDVDTYLKMSPSSIETEESVKKELKNLGVIYSYLNDDFKPAGNNGFWENLVSDMKEISSKFPETKFLVIEHKEDDTLVRYVFFNGEKIEKTEYDLNFIYSNEELEEIDENDLKQFFIFEWDE